MKSTLEFNLPEEKYEHLLAFYGADLYGVLWTVDQQLRSWMKYGHKFKTAHSALEATRKEIWNQMDNQGINFETFGA